MIRRMGGMDSYMLMSETPRYYAHTYKLAIVKPSPEGWSFERYREHLLRHIHRVPPLRWRYVPSPAGLAHPFWADDPEFNIDYHLRLVGCPAPGDRRAFCKFVSSVYAYPLDRTRPLWLIWVVEGLEGGRVALLMLVHHAYFDGAGASKAMMALMDGGPDEDPPPWDPEPIPSWWWRLGAGLRDLPISLMRGIPRTVSGLRRLRQIEREQREAGGPPYPSAAQMPATPLNRVLSHGRTIVFDTLPLEDFQRARPTREITINDVFQCCCAGMMRRQLAQMGYDPSHGPLVMGIAVAGKRPPGMEMQGNFASGDVGWLHIEITDARQRLQATHQSVLQMQEHFRASEGADRSSLMEVAPPWLVHFFGWMVRRRKGKFGFIGNGALSNVKGPRERMTICGHVVESWFSSGQIFDGSSINLTMWSYCDQVSLSITVDQQALPDAWPMVAYFRDELDALIALADEGRQIARSR